MDLNTSVITFSFDFFSWQTLKVFFQFFVDFGKFVYSSIALQLNHFTLAIFASLVTNTRLHPLSVSGFHVTRNKYRPTAALNTPKFAKTTTLCINIYYFCQYRMNKEFTTFTQLFLFSLIALLLSSIVGINGMARCFRVSLCKKNHLC